MSSYSVYCISTGASKARLRRVSRWMRGMDRSCLHDADSHAVYHVTMTLAAVVVVAWNRDRHLTNDIHTVFWICTGGIASSNPDKFNGEISIVQILRPLCLLPPLFSTPEAIAHRSASLPVPLSVRVPYY